MSPALELDSLLKRYGSVRAVDGISLTVERGQIFGLLGPNGSGKTTTLACALGLVRPTSGAARVLGEPATRLHRTLGRVGVVFDRPTHVPSLSIRQNMRYAARLRGHAGGRSEADALERVDLAHLARRRAGKLSLGQAKRLAIACALAGEPELLVLDEPLSGLDTLGVRSVLKLVRELASGGLTIVLSSHRLHEMQQVVSHVGVILGGKLVRQGALEELLGARSGLCRITVRGGDPDIVLARAGARVLERSTAPDGASEHIDADLGEVTTAEINRALIEAGCAVFALEPAARTLQAVFEELADKTAKAVETER